MIRSVACVNGYGTVVDSIYGDPMLVDSAARWRVELGEVGSSRFVREPDLRRATI